MYGRMLKFLAKSLQRAKAPRRRRGGGPAPRRARPWLEALEGRVVPSAGDWPMYNFDVAGTRDNTAERTLGPSNVGNLQVLWNYPTAGIVTGTPAVVNNVVYAGDSTGLFYALNSNGQLLWQTQLDGRVTASPLVTNGTVVIGTQTNGFIYGLNASTGAIKWQIHPNTSALAQVWGSATPVGHNVAIGYASGEEFASTPPVSRGSLVLLDPDTGHVIWQTYTVTDAQFAAGSTGAAIWSTPTYDPASNTIYAGTGNNYTDPTTGTSDAIIAFNAANGQIKWVNQREASDNWHPVFNPGSPDYDFGDSAHLYHLPNGHLVVGSGQKSGFFHVFNATTGDVINQIDLVPGSTLGGLFATAAVDPHTGVVFANARNPMAPGTTPNDTGDLFAIAPDGSHVLWSFPTAKPDQSGVALANGVVYFQSLDGFLYALNEDTGALLAKVATSGSDGGPAISNGQIYLGQGDVFRGGFAARGGITALGLAPAPQKGVFVQTNLVSNVSGLAQVTDANLKNPWGVSFSATSPFWVSNQGTNTSTLYAVTPSGTVTINSRVVGIPTNPTPPNGPTGQVQNSTTSFPVATGPTTTAPASFIFANLNGTIDGWNAAGDTGGLNAVVEATTPGAVYTGLALASTALGDFLYAANDAGTGSIDVFDGTWAPVTLGMNGFGTFSDPLLPTGLNLVPFNVMNLGGQIYVAYAPSGRANQTGATEGQGAVAIFDTSGNFLRQLVVGSKLASPWGLALAPATFGPFGGDLLVGNFAYNHSEINAFNPTTGAYAGTLTDANGNTIQNQALWSINFGRGGSNGSPNTLYFAAGIHAEADGLFGQIQAAPTLPAAPPVVPNLPGGVEQTFSTVPASNGDQNPYGVAFVPPDYHGGGVLQPGDILVSNFNNAGTPENPGGLQGTGTTIVRITPSGERSVFFQGPAGLGLTTALGVLKSGFVIVGNVPTTDGTFDTIQQGSLLVLDSNGNVVETLADSRLLDGPWDLALNDQGSRAQVFVSNVLSGTVTRIDLTIPHQGAPVVAGMTQIASGYRHQENDTALVVGPTGLAYDARRGVLYVASTDDNAIYAIHNAGRTHSDQGKGALVVRDDAHLHGPLGLVLAPNGDLIVANGDAVNEDDTQPSEIVEFTPSGHFVAQFSISAEPGGAFGIALNSSGGALRFAAVNDNDNTLLVWTFELEQPPHHRHDD
jgi:uncharacterized protein (TIGR03118 family)